jgi:hypothetical protein
MADTAYDNVEVRVKRRDDQGMYEVGVVIDGAFVPIAPVKIGHVEELVEREKQRAADEAAASDSEQ